MIDPNDVEQCHELLEQLIGHKTVDPDTACYAHFGIRFDNFCNVVVQLLPYCAESKGVITGKHFRGFAGENMYFIKREAVKP